MCGVSVNELYKECARLKKMGLGEKKIMISRDDEGNGFHTLFYGFTTDKKDIEMLSELFDNCCGNEASDVVILG